MFKGNLIFGSNEDVIYLVLLWFLMILTKNMNQLDFNEGMRSLDDKKVFQVSQFEDMTSRTGVDLVMIIPFNYTPDLSVLTVISSGSERLIRNRSLDTGIYTFMHQTNAFGVRIDA